MTAEKQAFYLITPTELDETHTDLESAMVGKYPSAVEFDTEEAAWHAAAEYVDDTYELDAFIEEGMIAGADTNGMVVMFSGNPVRFYQTFVAETKGSDREAFVLSRSEADEYFKDLVANW